MNVTLTDGGRSSAPGRFGLVVFAFLLLAVIGCGGPAVPASDVAGATELLKRSLDDWKAGKTTDELAGGKPPVFVAEDLWQKGYKLDSYGIAEPGQMLGTNVRLVVDIEASHPRLGKRKQSQAYLVTTTPALTISREDR
jgi:hypothetical protein